MEQMFRLVHSKRNLTLLSELGFAFLNCGQNHITTRCSGKTVQTTSDTTDSDDVQVLGSCKQQEKNIN